MVNEAHIAYNRDNYGYTPPMYGDYVSKNLGIVNANINQETTGGALIGGWKGDLEYTGDYGLYAVPQNTYEVTDSAELGEGQSHPQIRRNVHSPASMNSSIRRKARATSGSTRAR